MDTYILLECFNKVAGSIPLLTKKWPNFTER